jgi:uncharacterized protein (TIRG00374 family)
MNKQLFRMICILFVIVVGVSGAVIYFTFDVRAFQYLSMFKPWYLLLAFATVFAGLFFDATRLIALTNLSDEKIDYKHVLNVVLSNYFLALLTPGQSGGGIAQLMFLKRAGVPIAKATLIIIVRIFMSILFLFVTMPIVFCLDPNLVSGIPLEVLVPVSVLFFVVPILLVRFVYTGRLEKWLMRFCNRFSEKTQEAVFLWYRDFQQAMFLLAKHPKVVFRTFLESGISLLLIYSVVPICMMAFDIDFKWSVVMSRMCLLNLVLYFTPTPGGTGVAEGGFILLFKSLVPSGLAGVLAVLWRFFCEYVPFGLGGIVTIRAFGTDVLTEIRSRRNIE